MEDGTRIPIAQMTEEHAKNCLRMVIRRSREDKEMDDELWHDLAEIHGSHEDWGMRDSE